MANDKVKCPICGRVVYKITTEKIGTRYYCTDGCSKQQKELQQEDKYRRAILEYLMQLCEYEEPSPVWLATIKRLHDGEKHMKYQGILLTLKYYYETLGNPVRKTEEVLGIVDYYYIKAKEDYIAQMNIRRETELFKQQGKQLFTTTKVTVNTDKFINTESEIKKNIKPIDIGAIDIEGEFAK